MLARHRHVGILGASEIKEILQNSQTAHLGCWSHGEGYVVPITFVWTEGWLYGHTRPGKKIDMMRANPQVCCQIEMFQDITNWKSVIVWGEFEELSGDRAAEAMRMMIQKLGGHTSSLEADFASTLEQSILYGIKITKWTGRWEDSRDFPA